VGDGVYLWVIRRDESRTTRRGRMKGRSVTLQLGGGIKGGSVSSEKALRISSVVEGRIKREYVTYP
jgi:hypothetical protein